MSLTSTRPSAPDFPQSHQLLQHWREQYNRQGQDQRDPEAFLKIGRHVRMVIVMIASRMRHFGFRIIFTRVIMMLHSDFLALI